MKRLCIVIVNYKTPDLTLDCVKSLSYQIDSDQDCVVIVDNNSGQNDLARLQSGIEQDHLRDFVRLISSPANNGFSAGNNIGIKAVDAENYLLANSDTLFRDNAIAEILYAAKRYPRSGLISPRLEWADGQPQISCFRYHRPLSELIKSAGTDIITKLLKPYNVPLRVNDQPTCPHWTSFACVLIRRNVFDTIGFLDEGFFMFFEDVDFCRRAQNAGFGILNWPRAHVVHLRGQSSSVKKKQQALKRLPTYFYRSRARYYSKYYGKVGLILSNIFWYVGRSISLIKEIFLQKPRTLPESQWIDIWNI
jgi:GT2 family glycosyltransferase